MKKLKLRKLGSFLGFVFIFTLILLSGVFTLPVNAATVFQRAQDLVGDASSTILKISTPAALIGVGTGAVFKKFSMGDAQKVKTGSTVMWSSLIGWTVVNGLPLILESIKVYI